MPLKYYDFYSFQDSVRVEMLGHLTFIIYLATQALCNRQAYVLCYQIFIFFFFFCFSFCKISSLGVYSDGLMVQLSCLLVLYIIFTLRQHQICDKCNRFKMQHYTMYDATTLNPVHCIMTDLYYTGIFFFPPLLTFKLDFNFVFVKLNISIAEHHLPPCTS